MLGPNEHHIPRFFQRAFAVKRKGGEPNEIWEYREDNAELRSISQTGSEEHFYGADLDAKLKIPENSLGSHFASLRKQPVGAAVDSLLAAELVMHLAPRARHFRASMGEAVRQLMDETETLLGDSGRLAALMGVNADTPDDRFAEKMWESLGRLGADIEAIGLPRPLIERIGFFLVREQFDSTIVGSAASMRAMVDRFASEVPGHVRDGHNQALERFAEGPSPRRDLIASFSWTIEAAPLGGAILPDCVALALSPDEPPLPLMFVGAEIEAAIMPLTTEKLLVGWKSGTEIPDLSRFNADAAACSAEFFLANALDPEFQRLAGDIGSRSSRYFEKATQEAIDAHAPRQPPPDVGKSDPVLDHLALTESDLSIAYEVYLHDFGDAAIAERLAAAVRPVVEGFARAMPLARLDGITFADDFQAALRLYTDALGDPPPNAEATNSGLLGDIITRTQEGEIKGRVVLSLLVADYLLRETEEELAFGRRVLVHQLVLVALMEYHERVFPGFLAELPIEDELDAWLFPYGGDARNAYIAARIAGGFGEGPLLADFYRSSLLRCLRQLRAVSETERTCFAHHKDADRLAAIVFPFVGPALYFAAALLAHCEATDEDILDSEGRLRGLLEEMGLTFWLADFGKDLQRFFRDLGQWASLSDVLRFNRHVERLLWSVSIFPWKSAEGLRIEVLFPPGQRPSPVANDVSWPGPWS